MVTLVKEQPDVFVVYEGNEPIGNIRLERYGKNESGAGLRWMDDSFQRHHVHLVGATEESITLANPQHFVDIIRKETP